MHPVPPPRHREAECACSPGVAKSNFRGSGRLTAGAASGVPGTTNQHRSWRHPTTVRLALAGRHHSRSFRCSKQAGIRLAYPCPTAHERCAEEHRGALQTANEGERRSRPLVVIPAKVRNSHHFASYFRGQQSVIWDCKGWRLRHSPDCTLNRDLGPTELATSRNPDNTIQCAGQ